MSSATFTPPCDFYCPITGDLMVNPVMDNDGISYEENAILEWLKHKRISPMTRNPLIESDLRKNISLKNSIDAIRNILNEDQLKIKSKICEEEMEEFTEELNKINPIITFHASKLYVTLNIPDVPKRPPVDVAVCIDVSGSMGSEAVLQGDKGEKLNYGISVLSLTVCAAKTILNSLNENDNISIITYTDKSSVIVDCWSVSKENKSIIEKMLDQLKPLNTTNIWDGVKTSLDILRTKSPMNRMKGLFLLTDGVPNVEPSRGHEYMLEQYFKDNNTFNCMINCYGFGYQLKSDLLQNISSISGGDGFAFIPDSGLLGNIFIHGLSNFLTTAAVSPELKIKLMNGFKFSDGSAEKNIKINSLKYGQDKHLCFDYKINEEELLDDENFKAGDIELCINKNIFIKKDFGNNNDIDIESIINQQTRFKAIECIEECISYMKFNEKESVKIVINDFLDRVKDITQTDYVKNITFDFEGQIKMALNMTNVGEREDWFNKWGIHYLRSLHDAYCNEVCNNFKDKGVDNFGGKLFKTLRDTISDIFDNTPPPKRTIQQSYTYGSSGMRGGGGSRIIMGSAPLAPLATMASYNTQSGGCCARGSKIKMADGTIKNVEDIHKNEKVMTININTNKVDVTKIEAVISTKCENNYEYMVEIDNLKITPYHPIYVNEKWMFPIDISEPKKINCFDMFTFVTTDRKPVIVDDHIFATFGHHQKGDVIEHDYFGTDKIIKDLKCFTTYNFGYVHLTKDMFHRENGKVNKIIDIKITSFKTNIVELYMTANL